MIECGRVVGKTRGDDSAVGREIEMRKAKEKGTNTARDRESAAKPIQYTPHTEG